MGVSRKKTRIEFTYHPENEENDNRDNDLTVIFIRDDDQNVIKIGKNSQEAESSDSLPFQMLSEIVTNINNWLKTPEAIVYMPNLPNIKDHRNKSVAEFDQTIFDSASNIQAKVDESLSKYDSHTEEIASLSILESNFPEDIKETIGLTQEELNSIGSGPPLETPEKFKEELKQIQADRAKRPLMEDSSKKIRRKNEL